jgi:hypothetical protein
MSVACVHEAYDYFSDLTLLLAVLAGYLVSNFVFKKRQVGKGPRNAPESDKPHFDCTSLPVEVQARVAGFAGLESWANLASASSMNQYALMQNDALWGNLTGSPMGLAEYRRNVLGLDKLPALKLSTADDVKTVVRMIKAAEPSDNLAVEVVRVVDNTASSAHDLFWNGKGRKGASMTELYEVAAARADLFSADELEAVAHKVEEHTGLLDMLEVPEFSDEDFAAQLSADVDRQVSHQFHTSTAC